MNIDKHLEDICARFPIGTVNSLGLAQMSEFMAEVSAMEYMLPYSARVNELRNIKDTPDKYLVVAERYKIPQFYVEKFLSDPYMESFGAFG